MPKFRTKLYKTDRARDFEHEQDRRVRMRQIYETIDRQSFQWIVVLVAGVGFFLDGYTLFASNMALPMIAYVYWREETSSMRNTYINIATLAGTLLGQVMFGYLADRNGRKKMYGVELVLMIVSTLGVVMSSSGEHQSMDVFSWLIWWRIIVGIGVGADYPLSAVITSEFAPTKHRARMLATVFFMQPLGQIAGNLVSLIVVAVSKKQGFDDLTRTVDIMWRWVIGIGVIPGVIATLFRFAIPESPRYLLEVEDDPVTAEFDATTLFHEPSSTFTSPSIQTEDSWNHLPLPAISLTTHSIDEGRSPSQTEFLQPATLNSHWRLSRRDIIQYFWTEGNWRTLAGTSLSWLLLDFGFYGIGLSSPQFLAKTWGSLNITGKVPPWQTDDSPGANLYQMFLDSSTHALVILNAGSFLGGLALILIIHKLDRTGLQKITFLALAAHFIALGTMFITVHKEGPVAVALYIIGQALFNFGPNATTYILPSELFPTRYRATCHGISAGAGKLGSILVQVFSAYYNFGTGVGNEPTIRHGWILIVFSACMILGAAVTHFWIPPVQVRRGDTSGRVNMGARKKRGQLWGGKTVELEVLALGRMQERSLYSAWYLGGSSAGAGASVGGSPFGGMAVDG
ncbi:inorganic phosphate transporter [Aspergillus steynii IBT 23096]|uniref:Inorganic phosphate transporter n=1 Tax=Aspergillus steynii IBT 23096 TaxID=1392250 RepID=A0A2I2GP94_9EURO|nr:inorganic phosphate transporter [Aspergillus steynii IBT 23096]PLB54694.1 inorganic phosphate transporter [Aspergillus steynii IBT 23096]